MMHEHMQHVLTSLIADELVMMSPGKSEYRVRGACLHDMSQRRLCSC